MSESRNQKQKLVIIKVIHTVIWALYAFAISYILYAAITNIISPLLWTAVSLVIIEGIILLLNGWRCPLTRLGEKYTEHTNVGFDIFLPKWLARNNKTIFTVLFSIGVIIVIYRLLT